MLSCVYLLVFTFKLFDVQLLILCIVIIVCMFMNNVMFKLKGRGVGFI